ncbi:MAG: HAD family hydrolase [Euryarchaeota archaeon]|nr:HAD family hydrolase [Euryarchaeota archaeon]
MKKAAVFLDRDGTINFDSGYVSSPADLKIFPAALRGLKLLSEKGFSLFIVTNQSGLARGYFSENDLDDIHRRLLGDLKREGITIDEIAVCPHHPDEGCNCRKPSPLLVRRLANRHGLDLRRSFFVGDKLTDIRTGINAGCRTVLITPPDSRQQAEGEEKPDYVAADLEEAARWIIGLKD